jgi:AmmeMemoRadiSam system protein B/AmmeMemoRadiSam system protein A
VVRLPAVAGTFYPGDRSALHAEVARLLAAAPVRVARRPKALVVPHAGYVYSGPTAAAAYAQLRAPGPRVERVVLLGPAHHVAVAGLALPEADRFLTPLGEVPLDLEAARRALRHPQVTRSASAHILEHSLEVQLPFLQEALGPFALVPFAVGRATPRDVAEVLAELWGGDETLVVISTDLSHYLPYDDARAIDRLTARQILACDAEGLHADQACGRTPLSGLLYEGRRRGLEVEQLDLRNSGDTAGDRDAVVGYGAFAVHEPVPEVASSPDIHRRRAAIVTGLARAAVASLFGAPPPTAPAGESWLEERRACFVSLHRDGLLRGCIGTTEPRATLHEEVVRCAKAAASTDTRFPPVGPDELDELEIDVSVLSPLRSIEADDEAAALQAIRPGVDGLMLEVGGRRAVFIPAVWEQLPEPAAFLSALRRKAGLPDEWLPGTRLFRFTAEHYREAP